MKRSESRTSNPLVDVYRNVFITHFLFCLFCLYFSVTSWTPHYGIEQGLHNRKSGTGHNLSKYGPSLHEGNFAVKAVSTRARLSVHWQSAVINTIHADIFLLKHPPVTAELSTESPAAGPYAEKNFQRGFTEMMWWWRYPSPQPSLGSVVSSPSWGRGGAPAADAFSALFEFHRML